MKKIKNMSAWKRITLFFACVLLLAGIIVGRWFLLIEVPYIGYTKGFEKTVNWFDQIQYEKNVEDIKLEVHTPEHIGDEGFLAVRSGNFSIQIQEDGSYIYPEKPNISLFVWPKVFGDTKYGLMIEKNDDISEQSYIEFTKLNNKYVINPAFSEQKTIDCYNENEETVQKMLQIMDECWSFDGIKDIFDGFKVMKNDR